MKTYTFPNATVVKLNNRFFEHPDWCPYLTIERDRKYMLDALTLLRMHRVE